jgi:hypothetical protein
MQTLLLVGGEEFRPPTAEIAERFAGLLAQ